MPLGDRSKLPLVLFVEIVLPSKVRLSTTKDPVTLNVLEAESKTKLALSTRAPLLPTNTARLVVRSTTLKL